MLLGFWWDSPEVWRFQTTGLQEIGFVFLLSDLCSHWIGFYCRNSKKCRQQPQNDPQRNVEAPMLQWNCFDSLKTKKHQQKEAICHNLSFCWFTWRYKGYILISGQNYSRQISRLSDKSSLCVFFEVPLCLMTSRHSLWKYRINLLPSPRNPTKGGWRGGGAI